MEHRALEHIMDQLDIEVFSISDIGSLETLEDIYEQRSRLNDLTGFEPQSKSRSNPVLALDNAKSVIAIAVPYRIKNYRTSGTPRGFITNMAWEFDYHDVVKEKLEQIKEAILQAHPDAQFLSAVDTGPVNDRMTAYGAGLGWIGRNQFIIDDRVGTGFYIGILITDFSISGAKKWRTEISSKCDSCRKCQASCPANALTGERSFHGQLCVSTLTQLKRDLTYSERSRIGRSLYGCDICQWACPYNNQVSRIPEELLRKTPNVIDPFEILGLTNKTFKKNYGTMGFAWRGLRTLKRNALIVLGNGRKLEDYEKLLSQYPEVPDLLKPYAQWALMMIDPKRARIYFEELSNSDTFIKDEESRSALIKELHSIEVWMRYKFRNSNVFPYNTNNQ